MALLQDKAERNSIPIDGISRNNSIEQRLYIDIHMHISFKSIYIFVHIYV